MRDDYTYKIDCRHGVRRDDETVILHIYSYYKDKIEYFETSEQFKVDGVGESG